MPNTTEAANTDMVASVDVMPSDMDTMPSYMNEVPPDWDTKPAYMDTMPLYTSAAPPGTNTASANMNATASNALVGQAKPVSGLRDFVRDATADYRATDSFTLDDLEDPDRARLIAAAIFGIMQQNVGIFNSVRSSEGKIPSPRYRMLLEFAAVLITSTEDVAYLEFDESGNSGLYMYSYTGKHAGIWTAAQAGGMDMVYKALAALGVRQNEQNERAVIRVLTMTSERLEAKRAQNLMAFNNGIVDCSSGTPVFMPYTDKNGDANQTYTSVYGKEAYITSKAGVNYNPAASKPVFTCSNGKIWDPLTHIEEATGGNPDALKIILQSIVFILKGMSGGNVIWFMDGTDNGSGGGGKSTTGDILAAIAGRERTGYINLETIAADRFGMGAIVGKVFLFGNETSAGSKTIEQADKIKALMRGEPVKIEEKFKDAYSYEFKGVWIQCMNCDAPRFAERENALYRKVIPIYFPQAYTQGGPELVEIKDAFVKDPRVAEFMALYAIQTYGNIDRYDPEAVARLREKITDIRTAGSTAFEFLNTYTPEIKAHSTPVGMLYMFYAQWIKNNGYGMPLGLRSFKKEVQQWTASAPGWRFEHLENNRRIKPDKGIMIETYMKENPVPGYADGDRHTLRLSSRLQNHRDRDWLNQDKELVLRQDEIRRNYTAYQMAATTAYVEMNVAGTGMTLNEFVLNFDQWVATGCIAPEYTAPVSRPDGRGFWARNRGSVIGIHQAGYMRAVMRARTDPSVLESFSKFHRATY